MIFQQIIAGIITGSLYAIVALGLVIAYKVTGVMNFAYGYMGMISAYIFFTCFSVIGMNYIFAFLISVAFGAFVSYAVERGLLRPVRNISPASMVIITLGLLLLLEGIALQVWGNNYQQIPNLLNGLPLILKFSGGIIVIPQQNLLILGLVTGVIIALILYLNLTFQGKAMRAVAQNEEVSKLMGINSSLMMSISWIISGAIGSLAAVLVAPQTFVYPDMMLSLQIMGFTAAVLGGFESIPGSIIGGISIGVIENLVGTYISTNLKTTFSLAIIVAILLIKPEGLLGSAKARRV